MREEYLVALVMFAVLIIENGPTFLGSLIDQVAQVIIFILKAFRQREVGQDGCMVNTVELDLVENLVGILQCFGDIGKHLVHLLLGLEPLLLAIEHHVLIVELATGRNTDEALVCVGIILVDKVRIVGANEFDIQLLGKLVLPPVIMALLPVALFAGIHFFANYIAPAALWWAFPVASLTVFVIGGVLLFVMRGSIPHSERIIDFSVSNGKEDREKTVADVIGLLDSGENGRFAETLRKLLELIADDKVVDILVDKEKEAPEICVKWDGVEIGALPFENAEKTYMYNQNIIYLK